MNSFLEKSMCFIGIGVFHGLSFGHLDPYPNANPCIDCEEGGTE